MRHAEFPTADGGRVAVALDVADGRIITPQVSGDLAFDPSPVAAALDGVPADLGAPALAARVRAAIPFGAPVTSATVTAMAAAVRRAVADIPVVDRVGSFTPAEIDRLTAGWERFAWRIIPEQPLSPVLNLALDEALVDRVANHLRVPTLRFWGWDRPAVVLGRTQSVSNEVDVEAAAAVGMAVVRRMSGGGAMFVQPRGAITYSLYLPESAVAGLTIRQSYEVCDAWVVRALRGLGVEAHHVPVNDVAWAGGKIGGAAQARRRGVVLHHTTIAHALDAGEMTAVLRLGREKRRPRGTASAAKHVSPLAEQTSLSREAVVGELLGAFRSRYGGELDEPTADEMAAAEGLVKEKYATTEWRNAFE